MTTEKSIIRSEAVFSDDREYRYLHSKIWDKSKPLATVISISPSSSYNVATDTTTMLIKNNLFALGYGGVELVNLISKVDVEAKKLKSLEDSIGELTDQSLMESVQRTQTTILAWGRIASMNKAFQNREEDILEILKPYQEKLQVIVDMTGREMLHPLTPSIRNNWILQPYSYLG